MVSQKFDQVLHSVFMMSAVIIKPNDQNYKLQDFNHISIICIAITDGIHMPVVVLASKASTACASAWALYSE